MEDYTQLWQAVLEKLKQKTSKPSFETWMKEITFHALDIKKQEIFLIAPHDLAREQLETTHKKLIADTVYEIFGESLQVNFILSQTKENQFLPQKKYAQPNNKKTNSPHHMLNNRYIFETFVVGPGNRFAHAAALAVAESPSKSYNPLFIYGGVGLGKTHLMHAIGHYVMEHNPGANVQYLSSEKFTNEFINSIQYNKTEEFRNKYRNVDVLLIDDIQFLAGKEQTQEEFFHTFNTLHEDSKQIVISSDRPPKEIPTLEDRLRSRFEWGLITDITPPDLETRIAILRKKAKADGLDIPNEVMIYIANQINTNIRQLEGALIRVVAYSSLENKDIDADLAAEALKHFETPSNTRVISISDIQKAVANMYQLKIDDLKAKKRTKSIAFPRQIAMYLSRELTDCSLPKIGKEFGGRDHTTVIHACDKISSMIQTDALLQSRLKEIEQLLKS